MNLTFARFTRSVYFGEIECYVVDTDKTLSFIVPLAVSKRAREHKSIRK